MPEFERDAAHQKFLEIAFAYALLSDERRRKHYDATGNTAGSVAVDDNGFDWNVFYKTQFAECVTLEALDGFKKEYQGSEQEKRDVLEVYKIVHGNMDRLFERVMCSNPLDDDIRFRTIIEEAIEAKEVRMYEPFENDTELKRLKRRNKAAKEGKEAEEYAKELGVYEDLNDGTEESKLAAMIQKRSSNRAQLFLGNLEAKYAPKKETKRKVNPPSEEEFQKIRETFPNLHRKSMTGTIGSVLPPRKKTAPTEEEVATEASSEMGQASDDGDVDMDRQESSSEDGKEGEPLETSPSKPKRAVKGSKTAEKVVEKKVPAKASTNVGPVMTAKSKKGIVKGNDPVDDEDVQMVDAESDSIEEVPKPARSTRATKRSKIAGNATENQASAERESSKNVPVKKMNGKDGNTKGYSVKFDRDIVMVSLESESEKEVPKLAKAKRVTQASRGAQKAAAEVPVEEVPVGVSVKKVTAKKAALEKDPLKKVPVKKVPMKRTAPTKGIAKGHIAEDDED